MTYRKTTRSRNRIFPDFQFLGYFSPTSDFGTYLFSYCHSGTYFGTYLVSYFGPKARAYFLAGRLDRNKGVFTKKGPLYHGKRGLAKRGFCRRGVCRRGVGGWGFYWKSQEGGLPGGGGGGQGLLKIPGGGGSSRRGGGGPGAGGVYGEFGGEAPFTVKRGPFSVKTL